MKLGYTVKMYYEISRPVIVFCSFEWYKNCVYVGDVSSYRISRRYTRVAVILGVRKAAAFVFLMYCSFRRSNCCYRP